MLKGPVQIYLSIYFIYFEKCVPCLISHEYKKQMRKFLDLVGYYIQGFATRAAPLTN